MNRRVFLQWAGLGLAAGLMGNAYAKTAPSVPMTDVPITEQDVLQAQDEWAKGIVHIGKVYQDGGDYKAAASKMIDQLYGYGEGKVLFKPTKAAADQFRGTKAEALSYFVGGDLPEDHGFAIQPWSKVRFVNEGIDIDKDSAEAMGNYYFTDAKTGNEVKVEFTFIYRRAKDGHLVIDLHHSSLPYVPAAH
ncbi:MAG: hypothetical protein AB7S56_07755 [Halothiobacillaceae bacterium]